MTVGRAEAAGGPPAGGDTRPKGLAALRPPAGRLTPGPTCRVDFSRPLDFRFLGRPMTGFVGDTVASALYANGGPDLRAQPQVPSASRAV